jgi:hypothetical protein
MSSDGFLSRWSRRKLEKGDADQTHSPDPNAALSDHPTPPPDGLGTAAAAPPEPAGAHEDVSAEQLAQLPPIEEVGPETDILPFLRKGVPAVLRNAALRRVWALDPAIRDFVGDARDYAWDWNVPGGVPGFSPLLPGEGADGLVARAFERPRPDAGSKPVEEAAACPAHDGPEMQPDDPVELAREPSPEEGLNAAHASGPAAADKAGDVQPRRHGGALPS